MPPTPPRKTPPGSANFVLVGRRLPAATVAAGSGSAGNQQSRTGNQVGTARQAFEPECRRCIAPRTTNRCRTTRWMAVIRNSAKRRVEGVEFAAVGQITNFWQVSAGIASDEDRGARAITAYSTSSGATTQNSGVRWSPDLTGTVWTSYTLGQPDARWRSALRLGAEASWWLPAQSAATTSMPSIPSYWVADADGCVPA